MPANFLLSIASEKKHSVNKPVQTFFRSLSLSIVFLLYYYSLSEANGEKIVYLFAHHIFHANFVFVNKRANDAIHIHRSKKIEMRKKKKKNGCLSKSVRLVGRCCRRLLLGQTDFRETISSFSKNIHSEIKRGALAKDAVTIAKEEFI